MNQPISDPHSTGKLDRPRHLWRNLACFLLLLPFALILAIKIALWIADIFFGLGIFDPQIKVGPWTIAI
jgi:hypothetical protein